MGGRLIKAVLAAVAGLTLLHSPGEGAQAPLPRQGTDTETIVEETRRISDFEARLALARILSYDEKTLPASLDLWRRLARERPGDRVVLLETARVLRRLKRGGEAIKILEDLRREKEDGDLLLELARAYHQEGRHEEAVSLYRRLRAGGAPATVSLDVEEGDALLAAGRLGEAVAAFRRGHEKDPADPAAYRKLALALSWSGRDGEALPLLEDRFAKSPLDEEVGLELARLYARRGEGQRARGVLQGLLATNRDNASLLSALADVEAGMGHAVLSRRIYERLLERNPRDEALKTRYAGAMFLWGDFYGIEKIAAEILAARPGDRKARLLLADALAASQRYEEAEGIYRLLLLDDERDRDARLGLAGVKVREKDFPAALAAAEDLLASVPDDPQALVLKGDALLGMKRTAEAPAFYERAGTAEGWLKGGRARLALGDAAGAAVAFAAAEALAPKDPRIAFYRKGREGVTDEGFVTALLREKSQDPRLLKELGDLYAAEGIFPTAERFYRQALAADGDFFPARMALAETLGAAGKHDEALAVYRDLDAQLPQTVKIMLGKARVLSWARRYDESLDVYGKIRRLNPRDPVPLREMARVAGWAKRYDGAQSYYRLLQDPPVDRLLLSTLESLRASDGRPLTQALRAEGPRGEEGAPPYLLYEAVSRDLAGKGGLIGPSDRRAAEAILTERLPAYRLQKGAYLEGEMKSLAREKRFQGALEAARELVAAMPGNEEAWFDTAQLQCALGLCDEEGETYRHLLHLDPLHGLVREALQRQEERSRPLLAARQSYWHEDGYGDLARITRHRTDLDLVIPFRCRYHLSLSGHHWIEKPDFTGSSYGADGFTVALGGVVNAALRGEARWTHKVYRDAPLAARDTGFVGLSLRLRDYVRLGLSYERTDELYNYFGIRQGTQADVYSLTAESDLTRRLEVAGAVRHRRYRDDNQQNHLLVRGGYAFTDHPRILKVIVTGEYRDTQRENRFLYDGTGRLEDIVHPYWTPRHYYTAGLTVEWYHDLSRLFICGGKRHIYDIRLSAAADTNGNPALRAEVDWEWDFYRSWTLAVGAMIHRSRDWKGEALTGTIKRRF